MRSQLIIHTDKITSNVQAIDRRLRSGVKKMSVVKDNAYGHGIIEVAQHLESMTDWFCVARMQEGVQLREAGIERPILVFEIPEAESASLYPRYDLVATIADLETFDHLDPGTKYHVNFDTGMKRLGITPDKVSDAHQAMQKHTELKCTGIYTHFATADEADSPGVAEQLEQFNAIRAVFPSELMTHTANTGSIFYYTDLDLQFDAVRPGVCLYGYAPGNSPIPDLQPVLRWTSYLMQVREVKKGEAVGYGAAWTAPADGWVGTIPVGYSDGVPRVISSKFEISVGGKLLPQSGRITMDYLGVFSPEELHRGTPVELFDGGDLNPKVWAQKAGTIPYEITTGLNPRISRIYQP